MNVNIWDVNDAIQALVRASQPADVAALRDPETPLESLVGR
jgi:3-phenylpropionate/trans-cinnamate dioxygenase ferredoxin reductase subunit